MGGGENNCASWTSQSGYTVSLRGTTLQFALTLNMGILHDLLNSSCRSALDKSCLTKANEKITIIKLFTLRAIKPPHRCVAVTQTDSPPSSAGGGPMKENTQNVRERQN